MRIEISFFTQSWESTQFSSEELFLKVLNEHQLMFERSVSSIHLTGDGSKILSALNLAHIELSKYSNSVVFYVSMLSEAYKNNPNTPPKEKGNEWGRFKK